MNVINLVSEHTIEHRMLGLLEAKRTLAEGVLDQRGDLADIPLPTSRAAFVERMQAVLGARAEGEEEAAGAPPPTTALDRLREDLVGEHGAALRQILVREGEDTALVVVALPAEQLAEEERRLAEATGLNVKLIDPPAHEAMLRLAEAGLISMPAGDLREVYPAPGAEGAEDASRLLRGRSLVDRAEHKLKARRLCSRAVASRRRRGRPATEAARLAAGCLAALEGEHRRPEDGEAAAAYLLAPELGAGGRALDAVRILSGEEVEGGVVAPVRVLLDTVSRARRRAAAPISTWRPVGKCAVRTYRPEEQQSRPDHSRVRKAAAAAAVDARIHAARATTGASVNHLLLVEDGCGNLRQQLGIGGGAPGARTPDRILPIRTDLVDVEVAVVDSRLLAGVQDHCLPGPTLPFFSPPRLNAIGTTPSECPLLSGWDRG